MTKFIKEILDEINTNPNLLVKYKDDYTVKSLFKFGYDPSVKFVLPEGKPPFKPDAAPMGMSPSNFYQQIKKLVIFLRTDVSKIRLEQLFVQMLESIHPFEAELMIAIKDKTLDKLYPNITKEKLIEVGILNADMFPDYEPTKGKKLVVNIDDSAKTKDFFGKPKATEDVKDVPTRDQLEKLSKKEIDTLGNKFGLNLDRRKKKETMIDDFFSLIKDDGK